MKNLIVCFCLALPFLFFFNGCSKQEAFPEYSGPYLGQDPPGMTPEVFAPDIITPLHEVQNCLTISLDGKEIYWGLWYPEESINKILFSRLKNNKWTKPEFVFSSAVGNYNDDAPFLSPDGEKLYFISRRPSYEGDSSKLETVWVAERENKEWSEPKLLPQIINSMKFHMQFSVAENYTMYFRSKQGSDQKNNDIFYSKCLNGTYEAPVKLGKQISSQYSEFSPFISKDESYLIFARHGMPDGYGGSDLFISFKKAGSSWTESVNLGESINSSDWDNCPVISPDGKYLFFASNRSGRNKIYWVDVKIIEDLQKDLIR